MEKIHVKASIEYDVCIGKDILKDAGSILSGLKDIKKAVIVSDDNVFPLYGGIVKNAVEGAGMEPADFVFAHGEASKGMGTYEELMEFLCSEKLTRSDAIVALGGGVVGDLSGFAAATYQRGIRFIQIPTTLLAAVDSSVGGKTAINLAGGKNQAGCFYQPSAVLCDVAALATLPEEEFSNGMAEVIKYAMLGSEALFKKLAEHDAKENIEEIIKECVCMKRDIVEQDEFDRGTRMLLNLGHTLGHAVESCSDFEIAHGAAVAIGMAKMTKAAEKAGLCESGTGMALAEVLKKYSLPEDTGFSKEELLDAIRVDKKLSGSSIHAVIPERIGSAKIVKMEFGSFADFVRGAFDNE